ncbi:CAP family protein [Caulobacter sp. NIBR1757]|uniref:CAP family protein n=1 Tax=Caulobacter sp. NIBR1757 TaxID=3016000 RepID=UPI0022F13E3D|nr:CAP family protein [Caulobacter sp. NIBR1757]WGM38146.1 hypothetical protein AMEJIAPC_01048 [Caulobacter sp. NIBR1757]
MISLTLRRLVPLLVLAPAPAFAQDDFQSRVLAAHNAVRAQVGTPPLQWNSRLAADARAWADTLARKGRLQHDDQRSQGENLWMGTANFFSIEEMVGAWAEERADYRHGKFPDVAKKGRPVGHYTQMVWRTTREVGCATARTADEEVLVCRYSPPGNWIGQTAY